MARHFPKGLMSTPAKTHCHCVHDNCAFVPEKKSTCSKHSRLIRHVVVCPRRRSAGSRHHDPNNPSSTGSLLNCPGSVTPLQRKKRNCWRSFTTQSQFCLFPSETCGHDYIPNAKPFPCNCTEIHVNLQPEKMSSDCHCKSCTLLPRKLKMWHNSIFAKVGKRYCLIYLLVRQSPFSENEQSSGVWLTATNMIPWWWHHLVTFPSQPQQTVLSHPQQTISRTSR